MLLSPEAPIPLYIWDAHVGPILRSTDGYRGHPPDWRYTKEEEDLEGGYPGCHYGRREISFYPSRGGGRGSGEAGYCSGGGRRGGGGGVEAGPGRTIYFRGGTSDTASLRMQLWS